MNKRHHQRRKQHLLGLYLLMTFLVVVLIITISFLLRSKSDSTDVKSDVMAVNNVESSVDSNIDSIENSQNAENNNSDSSAEESSEATDTPKETEIVMNFMGDCILGTYMGEFTELRFNETAERVEPEYFFDGVKSVLDEGTFNITNCEGVFTDQPLVEIDKGYDPAFWFKSPSKNARVFKAGNIHAVGLSNNHIYDYGEEGKQDTINALEENDILWGDNNTPLELEHDGIKIVIFFVETWDEVCTSGKINEQIEEYSEKTDLQIVFFHCGTEGIHEPDPHKIEFAHSFVDSGADLVIGSHPHVLQPIEVYNDVTILYSLGNFVFGGNTHPENRTIVYTHKFNFKNNELVKEENEIHPCYIYTGDMNAFQPTLIEEGYDRQAVLDFMNGLTGSPF